MLITHQETNEEKPKLMWLPEWKRSKVAAGARGQQHDSAPLFQLLSSHLSRPRPQQPKADNH